MKLIFNKLLIFIVLNVIIISILNVVVPTNSGIEKKKIHFLNENANEIKYIAIGRSHAAAINFENFQDLGVNFALGGRDLKSIHFLLKYIVKVTPNLKVVFISISYSSFYYDNAAMTNSGLNDARKSLYFATPGFSYIEGDFINFIVGKCFNFIQADHGYTLLQKYFKKNVESLKKSEWSDTYMDSLQLIQNAKLQSERHSFDKYLSEKNNPQIAFENYIELIKIIKLLQKSHIKCVLFTPPFYYLYTEYYPKDQILDMERRVNLAADETNCLYYNDSSDSLYIYNYRLYHNADHLNEQGKQKYSLMMIERLKQSEY